jgi:hypothetical protein
MTKLGTHLCKKLINAQYSKFNIYMGVKLCSILDSLSCLHAKKMHMRASLQTYEKISKVTSCSSELMGGTNEKVFAAILKTTKFGSGSLQLNEYVGNVIMNRHFAANCLQHFTFLIFLCLLLAYSTNVLVLDA